MNPLAKFSAASIVGIALLLTLNPLSAGVVLIIDLILLPVAGVSPRRLARMLSPLIVMALSLHSQQFSTAGHRVKFFGRGGSFTFRRARLCWQ
jgi:hypothetical protein